MRVRAGRWEASPTPVTHMYASSEGQSAVLRVPPCAFRDFWGTAVKAVSLSISGPDSLPTAPSPLGPRGFSLGLAS